MDYDRIKDILNAEEMVEVFYQNEPIWINNLDPQKLTAQVTNTNEETIEVPIQELVEGEKKNS